MQETLLVTAVVVLRVVSNPFANVYQKQLTTRGNNPLIVNFLSYFILALFCSGLLFFIKDISILNNDFWIYSILGGIVGAVGNGFLIKALQMGDLSVLGPLNSYKSVVGIIFGILLLAEIPNLWGIFGIGLIIYGSYFVLETTDARFSWNLLRKKEIQFRLWAMILTAIEAIFIKKVIIAASPTLAFVSWCSFGALFSFIVLFPNMADVGKELKFTFRSQCLSKFLLLVLFIGVAQFSTTFVFDHMPVGYALSLFQLSTIVSIFFGYKFFREKEIRKKILGSVIMILGSILIILMK